VLYKTIHFLEVWMYRRSLICWLSTKVCAPFSVTKFWLLKIIWNALRSTRTRRSRNVDDSAVLPEPLWNFHLKCWSGTVDFPTKGRKLKLEGVFQFWTGDRQPGRDLESEKKMLFPFNWAHCAAFQDHKLGLVSVNWFCPWRLLQSRWKNYSWNNL
jgi:hypothetical protein